MPAVPRLSDLWRRSSTPSALGPAALLALSFVVSLCLIGILSYQAISSLTSADRLSSQYLPAERLAGEIVFYDELITNSARLAVATEDDTWILQYNQGVSDLERVFGETELLGETGLFSLDALGRIERSNELLVGIEARALDQLAVDRNTEASALLFGDEYQLQKAIYANGLASLRSEMRRGIDSGIRSERRAATVSLLISFAALGTSIIVFTWSGRALRRWQGRLEELEAQRHGEAEDLAEARFRELTESSSDVAMVIGDDLDVLYVSAAALPVLQWDVGDVVGSDLSSIVHPDDATELQTMIDYVRATDGEAMSCELRMRTADDRWRVMEVTGRDRRHDDRVGGVVINAHDVTERAHAQQRAQELLQAELAHSQRFRYQAEHDELTGLANRAAFQDHLASVVTEDASRLCLMMIDIDGFKDVNDTLGHQTGDVVLVAIADRLKSTLRGTDLVARIGGDEFAVVLHDVDAATVDQLSERLLLAVALPIQHDSGMVEMSASIGIAGPGFDSADPESVMSDADLAMYEAKRSGRNAVVRFEIDMREEFVTRVELKSELQRALTDGQFVVQYQPVWDLATGAMDAVEALVRWDHPTRGMLAPGQFLPAAEESGLVGDIDLFVLSEACRQAGSWKRSGSPSLQQLQIGVNISALDLSRVGLVDRIASELAAHEINASQLVIEITETAMMESLEVAKKCLGELGAMGVRLALDDFGTGYSSLMQLQTIDFDVLKIDQAFVAAEDGASQSVLETIVALANLLELVVVAEGIETKEQLTRMRRLGCDFGQGFLMARPMSAEAVTSLATTTGQLGPTESQWL